MDPAAGPQQSPGRRAGVLKACRQRVRDVLPIALTSWGAPVRRPACIRAHATRG